MIIANGHSNAPDSGQGKHQLSTQETRELLGSISIPPQPTIVRELLWERSQDEPDSQRIAQLISGDTGLAAAVLKTVNSPYYGLRAKVSSIQQAVSFLGMKNVSNLVMGLALRTSIAAQGMEDFWKQSSRVAALTNLLAQHLRLPIANEAQIYGLFYKCGIVVLLQRFPNYHETVELFSSVPWHEYTVLEDARHHTNHAVVGGLLASHWGLPLTVREAIQWHHEPAVFSPGNVSQDAANLVALGHLADRVELGLSKQMLGCACGDEFLDSSMKHLMLGERELLDFQDIVQDQFGAPSD